MKQTLILLLFIMVCAVGCSGPQGQTESKFKVGLRSFASADSASQFPGGLMLYAINETEGTSFSRIMSADSLDEIIPNGVWDFHVMGWDGTSSTGGDLSGKVYCASQRKVELNGEAVTIDLVASNANCGSAFFGATLSSQATGTTSTTEGSEYRFANINLQSCNAFDASISDAYAVCEYNPDASSAYINNKGVALSYKVVAHPYNKTKEGIFPIKERALAMGCFKAGVSSGKGDLEPESLQEFSALNIPLANGKGPWRYTLRAYLGSDNCSETYGYKDIHFPLKADEKNARLLKDSATGYAGLFVKSSAAEVCASPHKGSEAGGVASNFKGGAGTEGAPYIICNSMDLINLAENSEALADTTTFSINKSFILANDIDLNIHTAALNNGLAPRGAQGPETFFPIGKESDLNATGYSFSGTFDGAGKSIKGMRISKEDALMIGFISVLGNGGKLINTTFKHPEVSAGNVAGLVGQAEPGSSIYNVEVVGGRFESMGGNLGAIAGQFNGSILERIYVSDTYVRARGQEPDNFAADVGGIAGAVFDSQTIVKKVSFDGDVQIEGSFSNPIGGLFGSFGGASLSEAVSRGAIYSRGSNIGGLIGTQMSGSISDSYSNMYILAEADTPMNVGGLVGDSQAGAISNSYFSGQVVANCQSASMCESFGVREAVGETMGSTTFSNIRVHQFSKFNSILTNATESTDSGLISDPALSGAVSAAWKPQLAGRYPKLAFEKESACDHPDSSLSIALQEALANPRGTEENPIVICSFGQLAGLGAVDSTGKHFALGETIPMGQVTNYMGTMNGVLDGNDFSVLNAKIAVSASATNVGIFNEIGSAGVVRNIHLRGGLVAGSTQPSGYTGILAGVNNGLVENVSVQGSINPDGGGINSRIGMAVGQNNGSLKKVSASGLISGDGYLGGITSENVGSVKHSESRVYIQSNQMISTSSFMYAGGIAGVNASAGVIEQSSSNGSIGINLNFQEAKTIDNIGGFVGENNGAILNSMTDDGEININNNDGSLTLNSVGGFVGLNGSEASIDKSLSNTNVVINGGMETASLNIGGFVGNSVSSLSSNVYSFDPTYNQTSSQLDFSTASCTWDTGTNIGQLTLSFSYEADFPALAFGSTVTIGPDTYTLVADVAAAYTFEVTLSVDNCVSATYTGDLFGYNASGSFSWTSTDAFFASQSSLSDLNTYTSKSWSIGQFNGDGSGLNESKLLSYHLAKLQGQNPELPVIWELNDEGYPRLFGLND